MSDGRRATYGLDTPAIVGGALAALLAGAALTVFALSQASLGATGVSSGSWDLGVGLLLVGTVAAAVLFREASAQKHRERAAVCGRLDLAGAHRILDAGCGHGLLLFGALRNAPTAVGVGMDLPETLGPGSAGREWYRSNSEAEGVSDRAALLIADPRELPFRNDSFDVVVSRSMLPGQKSPDSFREALAELTRVLRPGGQLALVARDAYRMPAYGEVLDGRGFDSEIEGSGGLFSAPVVIARKPLPTSEHDGTGPDVLGAPPEDPERMDRPSRGTA